MHDKKMAYNKAENYSLNPNIGIAKAYLSAICLPHLAQTFQISLVYAFILGVRGPW